jgi:hypothetical protein
LSVFSVFRALSSKEFADRIGRRASWEFLLTLLIVYLTTLQLSHIIESNGTPTVALRVVEGDEKGTRCLGV